MYQRSLNPLGLTAEVPANHPVTLCAASAKLHTPPIVGLQAGHDLALTRYAQGAMLVWVGELISQRTAPSLRRRTFFLPSSSPNRCVPALALGLRPTPCSGRLIFLLLPKNVLFALL